MRRRSGPILALALAGAFGLMPARPAMAAEVWLHCVARSPHVTFDFQFMYDRSAAIAMLVPGTGPQKGVRYTAYDVDMTPVRIDAVFDGFAQVFLNPATGETTYLAIHGSGAGPPLDGTCRP